MKNRNVFKTLLLCVMCYCILFTFISNLVNGTSFDILSYRTFDDVAFQQVLRAIHQTVEPSTLLSLNYFGYGWIFWFVMAVITYPAYLLFHTGGSEALLIILPRMVSLLSAIGCSYLVYKIASIYTQKEWLKAAIVLLSPVFPTYAYFAGRFGTVCPTAFFAVLSVHLALKDEKITNKRLYQVLAAFGTSVAIKMSSMFFLPIIGLLLLSKYEFKFSKANFKIWIPAGLFFLVFTCTFISPAIILFWLFPQQAKLSFESIKWATLRGSSGTGEYYGFGYTLMHGIVEGSHSNWVFLILLSLLIATAVIFFLKNQARRFDFFCLAVGSMASFLVASLLSHQDGIYTVMYLFPVTALLPLGLCSFDLIRQIKWKKYLGYAITVALLCGQAYFVSQLDEFSPWSYFKNGIVTEQQLEQNNARRISVMKNSANLESSKQINVLADADISTFLSDLKYSGYRYIWTWDTVGEYENSGIEFICISKERKSLKQGDAWGNYISKIQPELRAVVESDKQAVDGLLRTNRMFGFGWEKIYEDNQCYIFKRSD